MNQKEHTQTPKSGLEWVQSALGIDAKRGRLREKLISALGGFVAIFSILIVSNTIVPLGDAALLVASMGASAVLLFAVPHGHLSQPWALLGGHLISAVIGVTCARYISYPLLAAALAVGVSIGLMYQFHCIHPPGGATALAAVMSGPSVLALGYEYIWMPVLLNVLVILSVAIAFNALFPWRRYPRAFAEQRDGPRHGYQAIAHEDFVYALSQLDTFVDVGEEDLLKIYALATGRHRVPVEQLRLGACYSNGEQGLSQAIRRLVDQDEASGQWIYKELSNRGPDNGLKRSDTISGEAFAQWAAYEVSWEKGQWVAAQTKNRP